MWGGFSVCLFIARGGCIEGHKPDGFLPLQGSVRCHIFYCKLLNFVV